MGVAGELILGAAAVPQAPDHCQRSMPASPASEHSSNTSSAPRLEVTASPVAATTRRRLADHSTASSGIPNAAARPKDQASPNPRVAPTGPHALAVPQGGRPGSGSLRVAMLAALNSANAMSITPRI